MQVVVPVALKNPRTARDRARLQPRPGASCSADEPNTRVGGKMLDHGANSADLTLDRQATWGMSV